MIGSEPWLLNVCWNSVPIIMISVLTSVMLRFIPLIAHQCRSKEPKMKLLIVVLFGSLFLLGCDQAELDREVDQWLKFHRASFDPIADSGLQPRAIESAEAQLGMLLFFSTTLSGTNDVACVSCHHPFLGGDDDLPLSVGVRAKNNAVLGYGRKSVDGTPLVPRNSPTTFNSSLWTRTIFHDGRIERLNPHADPVALISTPDSRYGDIDERARTL